MCWIMKSIATLFYFFVSFRSYNLYGLKALPSMKSFRPNTSVNADEDGNYEDWVEIYNYGGKPHQYERLRAFR